MGRFVIASYTPKEGKGAALLELVRGHMGVLRGEGLVTDRPAYVMRASDGTLIEVFEWKSVEAVEQAHNNRAVQALWEEFGKVCDYSALSDLDETKQMFAEFEPVD